MPYNVDNCDVTLLFFAIFLFSRSLARWAHFIGRRTAIAIEANQMAFASSYASGHTVVAFCVYTV